MQPRRFRVRANNFSLHPGGDNVVLNFGDEVFDRTGKIFNSAFGRLVCVGRRSQTLKNFFRSDFVEQRQIAVVTFAQNLSAFDRRLDAAIGFVAVTATVDEFTRRREVRKLLETVPQIFFVDAGFDQVNRAETGRINQKTAAEFNQLRDAGCVFAAQNFFADFADFEL